MKLYIIAGEASGDLHGSNLIRAFKKKRPEVECRAWGGDLMQAAGADLVKHYRDLAFMGFVEVLRNLRTILGNIAFCKRDILDYRPDALILIDYPGFNLRIAKWAKEQGIRVIYYISPQVWAWHTSRVRAIRRDVDKMLVILPFEQNFYREHGLDAEFVGQPLLDAIGERPAAKPLLERPKHITLLPGSRRQEVQRILPAMLEATRSFDDYDFTVAAATSLPESFYQSFTHGFPKVKVLSGRTYDLLDRSRAALVKSGTSTLETALLGVPQVVCYAGNPVSYMIARRLVNVRYISLVNLIVDAPLVRELIQHDLTPANLVQALSEILDPEQARKMEVEYARLRERLGGGGASEKAAAAILRVMEGK
ncbi:MAG: lipid-A-disaccharide synthase [Lewinellaceae bacterium]|nr:lipid-A-disaccharide synthase [Lewinellaceae bacterium]